MHQDDPVGEVFFALCKSVDSAVALGAWLRYKYSHTELCNMELNPRDYSLVEDFQKDYSVVSFLSKYKGLKTGIDLESTALQKFKSSEETCRETNKRLKTQLPPSGLGSIFHLAQRKIAKLLGPFSLFCVEEDFGWGPGATFDIRRSEAFLDTKICKLPISVSSRAKAFLSNTIEQDLHWSCVILGQYPDGPYSLLKTTWSIEDHCKITTVPKSAKTDRCIAMEPTGNAFLQKGFGGYIRKRLRTVGVDLNDQTVNQEYARRALEEGLATIDLKAASDTVSKELVWLLLPFEWASAMDSIRSHKALMPDGSSFVLEKFSSMGNGFTFELESLIFWAIAQSVKESVQDKGPVAVYGDDIIVSTSIAEELMSTLKYCGFESNVQKTYTSGLFYESCGKHYFSGVDVTPAYQKEVISDELSLIRLGNRLIRLALRGGFGYSLNKYCFSAWMRVRALASSYSLRMTIPLGSEGDDAWLVPKQYFFFNGRFDVRGLRCKVFSVRNSSFPAHELSLLAWTFRRGVKTEIPFNGVLESRTSSQLVSVHRFVQQTWQFGIDWE